ncbi:MAG: IS21 family transposase [Chloroflexi bacterium]|nr:IS21 family transposase [Chloroflexota bacterium]
MTFDAEAEKIGFSRFSDLHGGRRVYAQMEFWNDIRRRVRVEGQSKRKVMRETGVHWETLKKILGNSSPPGYRLSQPRPEPKIGPFRERITHIIESDKDVHRKQRHTAKRIFDRLKAEGYTGGYTQVKEAVREIKKTGREVFMPLVHRPGEAQVDFGHALACIGGVLQKIVFFVMCLPHSDAVYIQAFPRICTEVMWEGHVRAFAFFGGVPWRITYDNERILVGGILSARERKLTHGFLQLVSHYLFDHHFCLVRRANEKGVVESMVRYTRSNFLVPVPQVRDMNELNRYLEQRCLEELSRQVRGKDAPKSVLLRGDQRAFRPLPDEPFEACRQLSTTSDSLSLVRFDSNRYSVPVDYAHNMVVVKGYCDRVEICRGYELIASHDRLWGKEDASFEPRHYLRLLERKPGALDHARPLEDWELPECFGVLRRRLEAELEGEGTREYIRVLRLLEKHAITSLKAAIEQGLQIHAHSRDAIAQFLFPQEEWRLTTFSLDGHEHLRAVKVATSDITAYNELLACAGGER